MNRRKTITDEARVILCKRAYQIALDNTHSFEIENIGAALAYLLGAILNDGWVDVHGGKNDEHVGPLRRLLADDPQLLGYFRDVK